MEAECGVQVFLQVGGFEVFSMEKRERRVEWFLPLLAHLYIVFFQRSL